jgi:hypothetical protein
MKPINAEIIAQLTELTQNFDFPLSESSEPVNPFLWEVEARGEFNIENLLKS